MSADSGHTNSTSGGSLPLLSRGDSLVTYFKNVGKTILASDVSDDAESLLKERMTTDDGEIACKYPAQQLFSMFHYNQLYFSKNTTEKVDGIYYKHQSLVARYLLSNDSILIIHEPGTGKTISQLYSMMLLLKARIITKLYIINHNKKLNTEAIKSLREMYDRDFKSYFDDSSFNSFRNQFIHTLTEASLARTGYENNVGIMIDEAHNMVSDEALEDDDKPGKKTKKETEKSKKTKKPKSNYKADGTPKIVKVHDVDKFIEKLSKLEGVKLILATATPIFGKSSSRERLGKILNRSPYETAIHPSMVSFVKIHYEHLTTKQMHHEGEGYDYDTSNLSPEKRQWLEAYQQSSDWIMEKDKSGKEHVVPKFKGDWTFRMTNKLFFPFQLYVSEPAPTQIADFANLYARGHEISFGTNIKPLLIKSEEYVDENGDTVSHSGILHSIKEAIEKQKDNDGTIILYTDLKEKGLLKVCQFLKHQLGFELYRKKKASNIANTERIDEDDRKKLRIITDKIAEKNTGIDAIRKTFRTDRDTLNRLDRVLDDLSRSNLRRQEEDFGDGLEHLLEVEEMSLRSYGQYVETYRQEEETLTEGRLRINKLEEEKKELEEQEEAINRKNTPTHQEQKKQYYFTLITSNVTLQMKQMKGLEMTPEDLAAGKEAFNKDDNWDGSKVKVIVGSRVMRDGVNLKHCIQTHIVIPDWRIPSLIQAMHRGIRSNGHEELILRRALKLVGKVPSERKSKKTIDSDDDEVEDMETNDSTITRMMDRDEAIEKIRKEKITIEIYLHYLDTRLCTPESFDDAFPYFIQATDKDSTDMPKSAQKSEEKKQNWLMKEAGYKQAVGNWMDAQMRKAFQDIKQEKVTDRDKERAQRLVDMELIGMLGEEGEKITFKEALVRVLISNELYRGLTGLDANDDEGNSEDKYDDPENFMYQAGRNMYIKAVNNYTSVGASMMRLRSSAIDYKLNVTMDNRLKDSFDDPTDEGKFDDKKYQAFTPDKLFAVDDSDLFFSDDYVRLIIEKITKMLLKNGYLYTDAIVEKLSEKYSKRLIASAIIELVEFKRYIYNSKLGVEMMVKLHEVREFQSIGDEGKLVESILYLTTSESSLHPIISRVTDVARAVPMAPKMPEIEIREADRKLPLNDSSMFSKLKFVLSKAMKGIGLSDNEYLFLYQLSNHWAFKWDDIVLKDSRFSKETTKVNNDLKVYIFVKHIDKANIHIFSKRPLVYEYTIGTDRWRKSPDYEKISDEAGKSVKQEYRFIRYVSLVNNYENFRFAMDKNFTSMPFIEGTNGYERVSEFIRDFENLNGIILFKGFMKDADDEEDKKTDVDFISERIDKEETFINGEIAKHIIIKTSMARHSKGKQLSEILQEESKEKSKTEKSNMDVLTLVMDKLKSIINNEITFPFFLYEKAPKGRQLSIIEIKKRQKRVMMEAMNGKPTTQFKLKMVEDLDEDLREDLYSQIYAWPINEDTE